jgi:predicted dehydrogenase
MPHLSLPDVTNRVVLSAVCDPAPGRADAAAEKFSSPHAYTDYATFLRDSDVDAITLATPIGMHYEQGKQAILAGKHVHFNKSMTTTLAEANELIALAKAHNVILVASPGEMNRPHNQAIRTLIKSGAIGDLCWAVCGASFGRYHENEEFRLGNDPLGEVDSATDSAKFRKERHQLQAFVGVPHQIGGQGGDVVDCSSNLYWAR